MNKPLHETDFLRWTSGQASALRAAGAVGINTPAPIDWENVAEEIDSLGRSQRSELRSRIGVILEHLVKLIALPATAPRAGWLDTIDEQRAAIDRLLEDSPSLRREIPALLMAELPRAGRMVARSAARHGETLHTSIAALAFSAEQVVGDWYPPEP